MPPSPHGPPKNELLQEECYQRTAAAQPTVADEKEKEKIPYRDQPQNKSIEEWNCFDHILWMNVFWFVLLHVGAVYGLVLCFTDAYWLTIAFGIFVYSLSLFGITAGVHRLWSHRAYKATVPLKIFLAFCNSVSYQNSIFEWARDHRVHHKYTETNADPVNSKRGFFFSHVGWLVCKKHPDVTMIGGKVDMSDVLNDPVVFYQKKYYIPSVVVSCFILPTVIPWYFWGETLWTSYFVCMVLRYCAGLNATWLVNSAAHMFGDRPYDKSIAPVENLSVSFLTLGEGYHNYHHTFPWDYSVSEWGWRINFTTIALDIFSKFGLAYDFRQATPEMIKARIARTGKLGTEITTEHEYM